MHMSKAMRPSNGHVRKIRIIMLSSLRADPDVFVLNVVAALDRIFPNDQVVIE
jgi:hypothetical protein